MDNKICIKCKQLLPLTDFYKEVRVRSGFTARCKSCSKADATANYFSNKEAVLNRLHSSYCPVKERDKKLKRTYGLSSKDYETMLANQDGRCLICGSTNPNHNSGKFVVDHCHTTNKVRGLLCSQCNCGLGNFKDNPKSLRTAASYLERFYDG
jgi:hypothetical protein